MKKIITGIYLGFGLFDLINIMFDLPMRMMSKPTLMAILLVYYVLFSKKGHPLILMALIFSLMGDLFLLYPAGFILGLGAFLIAHIFYGLFFFQQRAMWSAKNNWTLGGLSLLLVLFWSMLFPESMKDYWLSVLAYSLILCSMLFLAINRKPSIPGYKNVLLGASLFVLSDILIAVEQVVPNVKIISVSIMVFYLIAQYLIIEGVVLYDNRQQSVA